MRRRYELLLITSDKVEIETEMDVQHAMEHNYPLIGEVGVARVGRGIRSVVINPAHIVMASRRGYPA
jgi:hypothetical protein